MIPKVQTALRGDRGRGKRASGAVAAILVAMFALVVAGLIGAATPARAATAFEITLSPLIGTPGVNQEIPQVTYGGKIGYALFVRNAGDSTTQHVAIVVKSKDDAASFYDSDNPACVKNPSNEKQAICTPVSGAFAPGEFLTANLRFTAPLTGPVTGMDVSSTAAVTIAVNAAARSAP